MQIKFCSDDRTASENESGVSEYFSLACLTMALVQCADRGILVYATEIIHLLNCITTNLSGITRCGKLGERLGRVRRPGSVQETIVLSCQTRNHSSMGCCWFPLFGGGTLGYKPIRFLGMYPSV